MIRAISIAIAAGLALGATAPARASEQAWSAAASAYAAAQAQAVTTETMPDLARCAAYWGEWNAALMEGLLLPKELAPLPQGVKLPDTQMVAVGFLLLLEETDEADAEYQRQKAQARRLIAETMNGNAASGQELFGRMGACKF